MSVSKILKSCDNNTPQGTLTNTRHILFLLSTDALSFSVAWFILDPQPAQDDIIFYINNMTATCRSFDH